MNFMDMCYELFQRISKIYDLSKDVQNYNRAIFYLSNFWNMDSETIINFIIEVRQDNIIDAAIQQLLRMENCFLATKVTFCNAFYDIAKELDVDYNQLRETWLLDPRIGRSHTFVYDNRGFGGACLPKDLVAMIYQSNIGNIDVALLKAVQQKNTL